MTEHPFSPDWCVAPAATLEDWLEENGLSAEVLAVACAGQARKGEALALIREVLDRKPLTAAHAACLRRGTGVSETFWLSYEQNYRAGLAAGLKDTT